MRLHLISAGAIVNYQDTNNRTALMFGNYMISNYILQFSFYFLKASHKCYVDLVSTLLNSSADPNIQDNNGND